MPLEIVIADTNAVIQLHLIVSKYVDLNDFKSIQLAVPLLVKREIRQLKPRRPKLRTTLDAILVEIESCQQLQEPSAEEVEVEYDFYAVQYDDLTEKHGADMSSLPSREDVHSLMMAERNRVSLLTNEGSLFKMSQVFYDGSKSYRLADILTVLVENGELTVKQLNDGLEALSAAGEVLRTDDRHRIGRISG